LPAARGCACASTPGGGGGSSGLLVVMGAAAFPRARRRRAWRRSADPHLPQSGPTLVPSAFFRVKDAFASSRPGFERAVW